MYKQDLQSWLDYRFPVRPGHGKWSDLMQALGNSSHLKRMARNRPRTIWIAYTSHWRSLVTDNQLLAQLHSTVISPLLLDYLRCLPLPMTDNSDKDFAATTSALDPPGEDIFLHPRGIKALYSHPLTQVGNYIALKTFTDQCQAWL